MRATLCHNLSFLCILRLENFNVSSICDEKIIINGQEEDESQEQGGGGEEMPHVMVVEKVHVAARNIHVSENTELYAS